MLPELPLLKIYRSLNLLKTEKITQYILEESIFDLRYIRLYDIIIPKENWLNCLQTVETLIRRRFLWLLIWSAVFATYPFRSLQSSMG